MTEATESRSQATTDTTASSGSTPAAEEPHDDIVFPETIPFLLVHLACLGVLWTGVSAWSLGLCAFMYFLRMFGVTGGYHRYFSHRSYKTSRVGQFLLAVLAQTSAQRGILWWAAKHRAHHKYSDTALDVHSPLQRGFWFAHVGWIFVPGNDDVDYDDIKDLSRYPELRFLDKHRYSPAVVLGFLFWWFLGWEGLFVGFILSTVLLYHGTFFINSLAHVVGSRRYVTGDDSRNNWWLALITMGEGWHNNHHHYHTSTRQGFFWWEVDFTYYILKMLSWTGVVWGLREPPKKLLVDQGPLGEHLLERVAHQLANSFQLEAICEKIQTFRKAEGDETEELQGVVARLRELSILPTLNDLQDRARRMFARTPSFEEIVQRAERLILEEISQRVFGTPFEPSTA